LGGNVPPTVRPQLHEIHEPQVAIHTEAVVLIHSVDTVINHEERQESHSSPSRHASRRFYMLSVRILLLRKHPCVLNETTYSRHFFAVF
jgi:hypothetical protein